MMAIVACRSGGDEKDGGNLVVVTGNWDDDGDGDNNGLVKVVLFVIMTS